MSDSSSSTRFLPRRKREAVAIAALGFASASLAGWPGPAGAQVPLDPIEAIRFEGYPDAPPAMVLPRKDELFFYPCSQCHDSMEPNPEVRELDATHDAELDHGMGRIWCISCHDLKNRDVLRTLLGEPVDFDQAYLVCGGCHASRHKDWVFGAHGKRVDNWNGERVLWSCTQCHNPHDPTLEPRAPQPPPPVRAGLRLEKGHRDAARKPWEPESEEANHGE